MATAPDRLRQIAILVSSVDAAAGRQILLHLPTDKARRVRELASQLGVVPPEEKRRILAEFQRSAAGTNDGPAWNSADTPSGLGRTPATRQMPAAAGPASRLPALGANAGDSDAASAEVQPPARPTRGDAPGQWQTLEPSATAWAAPPTSWMGLRPAALLRFVRNERPAVTAVVISQLAPEVAAEVLQHLPPEIAREVLLRLSRLQEIDPEAMQAIDEHLSQRLNEYQHHIESELENTRRIQSLLAAAPPHVRQHWSDVLSTDRGQAYSLPGAQATSAAAAPADLHHAGATQSLETNRDVLDLSKHAGADASEAGAQRPSSLPEAVANSTEMPDADSSRSDILPFAGGQRSQSVDRSLAQIEFEQILQLPPVMLANLLSNTDSQIVLLALAGATPRFTKRFMSMLDRRDAKILQSRLQQIGPIRLRDVDEAQRRIVENAMRISGQKAGSAGPAVWQRSRAA